MFCRTTLVSPEPAKILVSIIKLLLGIGAPTGVISSEYRQAVFPLGKANSIASHYRNCEFSFDQQNSPAEFTRLKPYVESALEKLKVL
jgi:hypothetical protein